MTTIAIKDVAHIQTMEPQGMRKVIGGYEGPEAGMYFSTSKAMFVESGGHTRVDYFYDDDGQVRPIGSTVLVTAAMSLTVGKYGSSK